MLPASNARHHGADFVQQSHLHRRAGEADGSEELNH